MSRFAPYGDGYTLTIAEHGVEFTVDRLRWEKDELKCELAVHCGIVGGRAVDGCLTRCTYNLSNQRARDEQAKFLIRRSRSNELPWLDWLEELSQRTLRQLREGLPGVLLRDVPLPGHEVEHNVYGWPLPADDATIGFGDAEGGKSVFALYAAGTLSAQGIPTLYTDFEWTAAPHRVRLERLFRDNLPAVHYVKCERPLIYEADRIRSYILKHGIKYAVLDSVGYGCTGRPEDAEHALAYFRAVRTLGIGSLHLAHITKPNKNDGTVEREAGTQRPFGSNFWHASARSTWFFKRTDPNKTGPNAPLTVGLFHRKCNNGPRHPSLAFQVTFSPERIVIRRVDVADVEDFGVSLPLWQRMRALLRNGHLPVAAIAEQLDVSEASIRQALKRDGDRAGKNGAISMFTRVDGGFIGLLATRTS